MRFFFETEEEVRPETLFRISSQRLGGEVVEEEAIQRGKREREGGDG